jgi:hypothetical protein
MGCPRILSGLKFSAMTRDWLLISLKVAQRLPIIEEAFFLLLIALI